MIKTFRGLIADGATDTIVLHTNDGSTGYRIAKFNLIPKKPVTSANECVIQIWKVNPGATSNEIDFSDQTLIGIGIYSNQTDSTYYPDDQTIIFDNEIFNQDIYLTLNNASGAEACNYYLELEQVKLDLNENTVTTLKNLRNLEPGG